MVGVKHLERIDVRIGEFMEPVVAADQRGMRNRREAAGVVNVANHLFRRCTRPRHVRRPPAREKLIERVVLGGDVAAGHERARNPRPADGFARIVDPRLEDRVGVEVDAEPGEAVNHFPHAVEATTPLFREKVLQRWRRRVHEIAEHVDVGAVAHGGDFDAPHELDPGRPACHGGRVAPSDGVVIRDAEDRHACGRRARDELAWRATPIRGGGVRVKIDQRRGLAPARVERPRP